LAFPATLREEGSSCGEKSLEADLLLPSSFVSSLLPTDTQTLGGAGFASQSYTFDTPLSLPLSLYTGLLVRLLPRPASSWTCIPLPDVEKGKPKRPTRITVILKTEEPKKRKDGRNEAVVSWEADFDVDEVFRRAGEEAAGELDEKSKVRLPPLYLYYLLSLLRKAGPELYTSFPSFLLP